MTAVSEKTTPPDPAALARLLDGEHAPVRSQVREILCRAEFRAAHSGDRDGYRAQVLDWMRAIAAEGTTGIGFPVEFGGEGRVGASIAAFETLALGDLSLLVKFGVQFGLFGGAVLHLGTRTHHERYLPEIMSLELLGCFAMTEIGHGSNVQDLETIARYDTEAQEFVINTPTPTARKDWIGNAARDGRMAAVFCRLIVAGADHGVHTLLVPIRDRKGRVLDRIEIEDCGEKLGLNGVDNGRIAFDNVRVPREALLNRYAVVSPEGVYSSPIENPTKRFFTMLGTLIQGRVSVSGAALSASKSSLTIAIRYSNRRRQFGPPKGREVRLLEYPTQQRRLLPALAKSYAIHFAQERLVAALHDAFTGEPPTEEQTQRELETRAAGLKAYSTWHATATIQECREACGGVGYLAENRFAALKADTDVFTTFEGDNTVLMQLVAKSLLTEYRDDFGELNPFETAGFIAAQFVEALVERTAAREIVARLADDLLPSRDSDDDLLNREYQLELLAWREDHILSSAARRLKGGMDAGMDSFEVFLACQDHLVNAAQAYVERVVLEAFVMAIEPLEDAGLHPWLGKLCDLYALTAIEADRAWFQEHGRLSSTRSKSVLRAVDRLCVELSAVAPDLVDGFGIPDQLLGAPIAQGAVSAPSR